MGTLWSARIVGAASDIRTAIEAVLDRVIAQMSNWEAGSDISHFNTSPIGRWLPLPADMLTVLRAGLDIARISEGAFDPAIGRLAARWGFGPGTDGPAPTAAWRAVEVADGQARRTADVALDFSAIAKGFAVDAVAAMLRDRGLAHFLVEIGGELAGCGVRPDRQPWWVDVEPPTDLSVPVLRVALSGLAVATSGDYRRWRVEDGRRLSHSIDPTAAAPINNDVASVTVLHDSAMLADAWATAITVLGHDLGMALATRHGLAARLVRREGVRGQEYMTPALAAMLD